MFLSKLALFFHLYKRERSSKPASKFRKNLQSLNFQLILQFTMKHSASVDNFRKKAAYTSKITKNIAIKASDFSTYFSMFLANSRGKDKMLSLFQYLFEFFCTCGKHSNIPLNQKIYQQMKFLDMVIYYNLKESISSARKVFRLFRFFDEIKGLTKIVKTDRPLLYILLSIFTYSCSCSYYVCDNSLWFVGILIKSKAIDKSVKKAFKRKKNMFSLFRIVAYLIILIYSIILQIKDNKSIEQQLKLISKKDQIRIQQQCGDQLKKMMKKLIDGRRKYRFYKLEIVISILRFIMLTSSLKLKGYQYLDPIFVGVCGLVSSILNFLKTLFQKKIVINLQKTQQK